MVILIRSYFVPFGITEIFTDDGLEFTTCVSSKLWESNTRCPFCILTGPVFSPKVTVNTTKKLLFVNVYPNDDFNNDSFLRALLQLRNTPDPDCDLSPAEIELCRPLRNVFFVCQARCETL